MRIITIITTVVMGTLAMGLGGCSWADAQFDWPWNRRSVPVTDAVWTSPEDWPKNTPHPDDPNAATKDPGDPTTQATSRPAVVQEEPLKIGETREITSSVLSIRGKYITVQDILEEAKDELSGIKLNDAFERNVAAVVNRTIFRRIHSELIFAEANARLSKPQKEHVEEQVAKIKSAMIAQSGGSQTRLETSLAADNLKLDDVLNDDRRRITVQLYQQVKFFPAISITRPMLLGYYNKNQAKFSVEKKVGMQIVAVLSNIGLPEDVRYRPSDQELAKSRAAAKEIIEKADKLLKDGADFTEVARKYSKVKADTGGKLPLWPVGTFRQKKVESAAFALKQGRRSGIVETDLVRNNDGTIANYGGFYIVKAYEIQEGTITSFEDAQEEIDKILRDNQHRRLNMEFSDRLYKEAGIPQSPEFIKTAVDKAIDIYSKASD